MREFSFGQYYHGDSVIHSLDARFKLVSTIAFITAIFLVDGFTSFCAVIVFLFGVIMLTKVPFRVVLKTLKPILFVVILTGLLNVFFYQEGNIIFELGFIKIYDEAIKYSIFMALRLLLLVMGSSIMTLTTQPVELTDAIESLLSPLKLVKFPVHELALIMSIALRFIPTLMDEADRIIRAQKARGADFESGSLISRAKSLVPILIPLLVSAFRRADELADAMDARCYSGGKNRTKYKQFKVKIDDFTAILSVGLLICVILIVNAI